MYSVHMYVIYICTMPDAIHSELTRVYTQYHVHIHVYMHCCYMHMWHNHLEFRYYNNAKVSLKHHAFTLVFIEEVICPACMFEADLATCMYSV